MRPVRDARATLVDLLERVLDKGLVLDADIIITVAGIPLLGVHLNAVLAGMETMLSYGIWRDWDKAQRATSGTLTGGVVARHTSSTGPECGVDG